MRVSSYSNTYLAESADCDEDDAERRERDHGVLGRAANHDAIATESERTRTSPYVIFRAHTHTRGQPHLSEFTSLSREPRQIDSECTTSYVSYTVSTACNPLISLAHTLRGYKRGMSSTK